MLFPLLPMKRNIIPFRSESKTQLNCVHTMNIETAWKIQNDTEPKSKAKENHKKKKEINITHLNPSK